MNWNRNSKLGGAIAVACFVGCLGAAPEAAAQHNLRVHVFAGAYTSTTVHVADEMGFFTKNGLRVEKIQAPSSSAAIAAMLGEASM